MLWSFVVWSKADSIVTFYLTSKTNVEAGPNVVIHCPVCLQTDVKATTYEVEIEEKFLGLVTVNRVWRSVVQCAACNAMLDSRICVFDLEGQFPEDIADHLHHDAGFVRKALAILAVLLFLLPFVGTAMALIALAANRRFRSWPRAVSFLALAANIIFWVAWTVCLRPMLIDMK